MKRRVVITGMGCVTPLGHDVETLWSSLLGGDSGLGVTELFDASTFPTTFSSQVKGFDLPAELADGRHRHAGRHTRFALAAALEAWRAAGLGDSGRFDPDRTGIYLGSGEGSLDFENFTSLLVDGWGEQKLDTAAWGRHAFERMSVHRETEQEANMVVAHLAAELGVRGPAFNCLTACAASTQATGEATQIIRYGDADAMVTGGAHSMIHPYGMTGFIRLTALSGRNDDIPRASRPFDLTRDGFVLGEGASILVLEEYELAASRGAPMLAEIIGYGSSADAYRITDQDPEGEGAAAGMRAALEDAGLTPADIDYISAHGTSTPLNDSVETRAIKAVFGDRAPDVPISSVKGALGHLIAAAGATELITCVLALRDGIIPPTANYQVPDPECDLDYVPNVPRKMELNTIMSNSFGFGGQNDTLIIRRI
ncbi:MAG TPA: beta-ketoacyl-[acyl-carrier-protein] synthase family protein [Phycisphaerae bacterium]|nr:beta-ketoacyl-[acyl-carrier-protein] synthase family protein [Phycisphaerae bacterium]